MTRPANPIRPTSASKSGQTPPRVVVMIAAGVVVVLGLVFLGVWVLGEDDQRPKRTDRYRPTSPYLQDSDPRPRPVVVEREPEAKAEIVADPPGEVVSQPTAPERVKPKPPERPPLEVVQGVLIEAPFRFLVGGREVRIGPGDFCAAANPGVLYEFLVRSGWADPGFRINLPRTPVQFAEAEFAPDKLVCSLSRANWMDTWPQISTWAHGFLPAEYDDADEAVIGHRVSGGIEEEEAARGAVVLYPQMRADERRVTGPVPPAPPPTTETGPTTTTARTSKTAKDSSGGGAATEPVAPQSDGVEAEVASDDPFELPHALTEKRIVGRAGHLTVPARVNRATQRGFRARVRSIPKSKGDQGGAVTAPPPPPEVWIVVTLDAIEFELSKLDAPGMMVGYGSLTHVTGHTEFPMLRPEIRWRSADGPPMRTTGDTGARTLFQREPDGFFWFIREESQARINVEDAQYASDASAWYLTSLRKPDDAEKLFLCSNLGRPKVVDCGLDFGVVKLSGVMLTIAPKLTPGPVPADLIDRPVGVTLQLLLGGVRRDRKLSRGLIGGIVAPNDQFGRIPTHHHYEYVTPTEWEHTLFIPGEIVTIHAAAEGPRQLGVDWGTAQAAEEAIASGTVLLEPPQMWSTSVSVSVLAPDGTKLPSAAIWIELIDRHNATQRLVPPPPPPDRSTRWRHPTYLDWRLQWRLDSVAFGTLENEVRYPSLSDWDRAFGIGQTWVSTHQAEVAERQKTDWLFVHKQAHGLLKLPEQGTALYYQEFGPRLEESEIKQPAPARTPLRRALPFELPSHIVGQKPFMAAKALMQRPLSQKLPLRSAVELCDPPHLYPPGTIVCLDNGWWVVACHKDYGWGAVFVPWGWKDEVNIQLRPWSEMNWGWHAIPTGW